MSLKVLIEGMEIEVADAAGVAMVVVRLGRFFRRARQSFGGFVEAGQAVIQKWERRKTT